MPHLFICFYKLIHESSRTQFFCCCETLEYLTFCRVKLQEFSRMACGCTYCHIYIFVNSVYCQQYILTMCTHLLEMGRELKRENKKNFRIYEFYNPTIFPIFLFICLLLFLRFIFIHIFIHFSVTIFTSVQQIL